jgi:hypothetical protein
VLNKTPFSLFLHKIFLTQAWYNTPVIPATLEEQTGGGCAQGQPGKRWGEPISKTTHKQNGRVGGDDSNGRVLKKLNSNPATTSSCSKATAKE